MKTYDTITDLIGSTPLLKLNRFAAAENLGAEVYAKLEYFNPAGSVKDRIAYAMITDAEKSGALKPGSVIIEPTSGNTGIGLAAVAAARGYRIIIVMPETMSVERRQLMKAYGAELVLTEGAKGMKGAIAKAQELAAQTPDSFIPGQFTNPANPSAHRATTGPEIWNDTDGTVDMVVDSFSMDGTHDGEADVAGPYLTVREALLIRSDSASEITGTDSLSDKTVCAVAGSAADDNIRNRTKNIRTTVAERDTYPQCMTALMIGEADAVAADDAIAAGLASNNTGDHLKIVDVPDTTWSYGIAVKSGQDELVGQIDAALRAMVKDGSWQKAAADMGKSIGYTPDASMNPPKATAKAPSSGASAASEK